MSEYRVFAGDHYYPGGGYDDYIDKGDSVAEATEILASLGADNRPGFGWAQLVLDDKVVARWNDGRWVNDKGHRYVDPSEVENFYIIAEHPGQWFTKPYGGGVSDNPRCVIVYFNDESLGGILTEMDNAELTAHLLPVSILTRLGSGTATDLDHEILSQLKKRDIASASTD